jgi:hypothetical protein
MPGEQAVVISSVVTFPELLDGHTVLDIVRLARIPQWLAELPDRGRRREARLTSGVGASSSRCAVLPRHRGARRPARAAPRQPGEVGTGRLVTSGALILFVALAALTTGPESDVKVKATRSAWESFWMPPSCARC